MLGIDALLLASYMLAGAFAPPMLISILSFQSSLDSLSLLGNGSSQAASNGNEMSTDSLLSGLQLESLF